MIGVRADGTKEIVALADGFRESTDSRADLLGEAQAPRHAGARPGGRGRCLGFWKAMREVCPHTREQRCW